MKKQTIAIIGLGRFGKLLYDKVVDLDLDFIDVVAVTSRPADFPDYRVVTEEEAKQADIIIPAVPISAFEETIKRLSDGINPQALVIDLCSVKVKPVEWMVQHLPASVQICGTHPIFGPDSVAANNNSWDNLPMVVCPVRLSPPNQSLILQVVQLLGVKGIEMTPEQHDRKMAYSLLYTHLIGRIGETIELEPTGIDTLGFTQLLKVQKYVVNDSWQLFADMNHYNPYSGEMRERVRDALGEIEDRIGKRT